MPNSAGCACCHCRPGRLVRRIISSASWPNSSLAGVLTTCCRAENRSETPETDDPPEPPADPVLVCAAQPLRRCRPGGRPPGTPPGPPADPGLVCAAQPLSRGPPGGPPPRNPPQTRWWYAPRSREDGAGPG